MAERKGAGGALLHYCVRCGEQTADGGLPLEHRQLRLLVLQVGLLHPQLLEYLPHWLHQSEVNSEVGIQNVQVQVAQH